MAVAALLVGLPAAVVAFGLGSIGGLGVGASAALGSLAAVGAFVAQVLALGWARTVSPTLVQGMAFGGFLFLLLMVGGVYAVLHATASWFVPKAFAGGLLALVPVAIFEAHQARHGRIAEVALDADRSARKGPA